MTETPSDPPFSAHERQGDGSARGLGPPVGRRRAPPTRLWTAPRPSRSPPVFSDSVPARRKLAVGDPGERRRERRCESGVEEPFSRGMGRGPRWHRGDVATGGRAGECAGCFLVRQRETRKGPDLQPRDRLPASSQASGSAMDAGCDVLNGWRRQDRVSGSRSANGGGMENSAALRRVLPLKSFVADQSEIHPRRDLAEETAWRGRWR